MPYTPHEGNQPASAGDKKKGREYEHATWATGTGGHPKTAGGETVTRGPGGAAIPTRGLNRKDQRYALSEGELITRRQARAATELGDTVLRRGASGTWLVRSPSGNNYHISASIDHCDCPDFYRIRASGYGTALCKHLYLVDAAITAAGGADNMPVSPQFVAEFLGIETRTVVQLLGQGLIPGTRVHNVWVITWDEDTQDAVADYHARLIHPGDIVIPP